MMTFEQHRREAESYLKSAEDDPTGVPADVTRWLAKAQVHATLALVAAAAEDRADREMNRSPIFSTYILGLPPDNAS